MSENEELEVLAEIESEEATPKKRVFRKLDEREWGQVVALWEAGAVTTTELAEKHGVAKATITAGLNKRGAVYGRQAVEDAQQIAKDSREDISLLITRAKETKDFHYRTSTQLASLAQKKIILAEKGEMSYARADEELKTILVAMKIQGEARKERFAVLGLDNPDAFITDELPELSIVEMSSHEIEQIREYQERLALESKLEIDLDENLGE